MDSLWNLSDPQLASAGGIILVMLGSWFVAIELVIRFKGYAFKVINMTCDGSADTEKTANFERWELRRARWMWVGLTLITIGSLLQLYGTLAPAFISSEAHTPTHFQINVDSEAAAWAQAFLSALAIVASLWVVNRQHQLELKRNNEAEAQRKRQHLESAFRLIEAVHKVTKKIKKWSEAEEGEQGDPYDFARMKIELEGLVDALRQTDFGRFDQHLPIEATLVALSAARFMLARLTPVYAGAQLSAIEISEMASDLGDLLKERLDNIHVAYPSYEVK
jgi:hypothetical protein